MLVLEQIGHALVYFIENLLIIIYILYKYCFSC